MVSWSIPAFAISYSVTSREDYRDRLGNSKSRVYGTIAFDSDYPCNTTTGRCGENFDQSQIGLLSIDMMTFETLHSTVAGGALILKYHATGLSGDGSTFGNIRAYYTQVPSAADTTAAAFVSAPTYDLSLVTAHPFLAVGDAI